MRNINIRLEFIGIATLLLLFICVDLSAQSLSVQDIEMETGKQTQMVVMLMGGTAMTSLQFNLKLPAGVTLSEEGGTYGTSLGKASDGHSLCVLPLDSGDYLFVFYSMSLNTFKDGELLRIPINISDRMPISRGQLYTIHMADTNAVSRTIDNVDIMTAIRPPKASQQTNLVVPTYTLGGFRPLATPARRGVYVQNNRKVIVK